MKRYIFPILLVCVFLASCNDSFLDLYPQDTITDENFWQNESHVKSAANVFSAVLVGKDYLNMTEIMAESCPWAVPTAYRTIGGGNYSTDISQINSIWKKLYYCIGETNYFLNNYKRAVTLSDSIRERYAAEAYFYRAYSYWMLTTYFGDVPYITDELNVNSADVYRGRDPRDTVIANITRDLEAHYKYLPEYILAGGDEFGRISQEAALALLSRIYLYNGMWEKCVDAAQRAMAIPYYKLYSTGHPDVDYVNLFNYTGRASRNSDDHEVILAYVYNYDLGADARTSHNLSREAWVPNDYARWVPTESMIECYLTKDGKIWDPSTAATYEDVFKDRDPRMCQSILAPGTAWTGGKDGNVDNANNGIFTYPKLSNDKKGCMTYSGYYLRKYVEPSTVQYVGHDDNDIVIIRYAEVLLNYAEAKERLGTLTQNDLDITINKLRDRVGMVHMTLDNLPVGSDIRTEIRRERRVEMFFEGQRYFDIIRWKEGNLLGNDLLGVKREWLDQSKLSTDLDDLSWDNVNGEDYLLIESGRTFDSDKNYLLSLPFAQMQLNPKLKPNNPGWD
ncbi:MAG: RagB/SusD family nutrient uptake outer membrane protein [Bacteroidales bacterium]|nr:RagB/SusD family nutrient uptake outer membrane protein [Bacteroidales bacterium]MCI2145873.1 RagB/SusD family nutrient uptake outer membrane protein [Bacteroidales bacterium]